MNQKTKKESRGESAHVDADGQYRISIPARDDVIEALEAAGSPLPPRELFRALGLPSRKQQAAMSRRLRAMIRDGQIITNRRGHYCLMKRLDVVTGRVIGHRDGYGFLVPDEGGDDFYLSPRQMREVMHGDRVAARPGPPDHRGRSEAKLVEVLERNTREVVGRYAKESGVGFVVPDNSRIAHTVTVAPRHTGGAKPGQIVVAELLEQPGRNNQPVGQITEVLGGADAPGIETEVAIRSHGIPHVFPDEVIAEAEGFGSRVAPSVKQGREDLRPLPLVTIDGADAKDFDDAVYCEPVGTGWRLIVAIADVSHYVTRGSALDDEARERGTSVYFSRRVVPMLPETLSNGLCSLNPKVDRLCMACEMHVSDEGLVTVSRFFEGVMRSHARLTYDEVAAALFEDDAAARKRVDRLLPHLEHLDAVFRALLKARRGRGAIEFDMPEVGFAFDRHGRIARATTRMRNDAHRIIEECMIAANVEAAKFLKTHRLPALYRVHAGPAEEALEELALFLEAYGIRLKRRDKISPADYNAVVQQIRGRPDEALIETVMLRSLKQAVYQPANIGHFGLALTEYAHFTSPIRRYPDLLVHRGIRHLLRGGPAGAFEHDRAEMERLGQQCSTSERRADEATREAMDWLKCEFMADKIGETFDAVVTGVADFGLFVQIPEFQIEGLVHISALGADYFRRDAVHRRLEGDRTGTRYQLSDKLRVRVAGVDLEERKIDFELADGAGRSRRKRRRRS